MKATTADLILLGAILITLIIAQTSYYRSVAVERELQELKAKIENLERSAP